MIARMLVLTLGMVLHNMSIANADTLILTEKNSVVFRGTVTDDSVSKAQQELLEKAKEGKALYLVLDTPGGSIDAGDALMETIKGLNVKVHTVTLFAASMGFQFVQNLDRRYITSSGVLMSHRAKIGMSGEVPGEFIVRLNAFLRSLNRLNTIAANRMSMDVNKYEDMIRDEYWVEGADSVADKAADKVVAVRCGAGLEGTTAILINTIFGSVTLKMSKCPLIRTPIGVSFGDAMTDEGKAYVNTLFYNKPQFVHQYIKTNEFQRIEK